MRMLLRPLSFRRSFGWMVLACLLVAIFTAPAHAVKPFRNPVYKQPKAPLERASDFARVEKRQHRISRGPTGPSVAGNPVKIYRLPAWQWGSLKQR